MSEKANRMKSFVKKLGEEKSFKPLIFIVPMLMVMLGTVWNYSTNQNLEWTWLLIIGAFVVLEYVELSRLYNKKSEE